MIGFYVSAGLLTPEHMRRIGPALAEFLWLISHETRDEGRVLNGAPITLKRIADDLGETDRTARRNLERLESEGYITRDREGATAYEYRIANSKKWVKTSGQKCPEGEDKNVRTSGQECPQPPDKNVRTNKEVDSSRQVDKVDKPTSGAHPTLEDVTLYCKERGNTVDSQQWMDHYQSNGWKVGPNSMRDWKAAVRTWERNRKGQHHANYNRAEQRQANNLAARERVRASIMAGG